MTNEEIRKGSKELIVEWLDDLLEWKNINEGIYISLRGLLNNSLAEARSDERTRLIKEIEEYMTTLSGRNLFNAEEAYKYIQNKLNSLK